MASPPSRGTTTGRVAAGRAPGTSGTLLCPAPLVGGRGLCVPEQGQAAVPPTSGWERTPRRGRETLPAPRPSAGGRVEAPVMGALLGDSLGRVGGMPGALPCDTLPEPARDPLLSRCIPRSLPCFSLQPDGAVPGAGPLPCLTPGPAWIGPLPCPHPPEPTGTTPTACFTGGAPTATPHPGPLQEKTGVTLLGHLTPVIFPAWCRGPDPTIF